MATIKGRSLARERIRLDRGHRTLEDLGNGLVRGKTQNKPAKDWEIDWFEKVPGPSHTGDNQNLTKLFVTLSPLVTGVGLLPEFVNASLSMTTIWA